MNDKLKKIIFNKLYSDLSKAEIIFYNNSLWFIDRENKYWYLELENGGILYWRYQFFTNFFALFSMNEDEFEPLIKEWVESALNCGVNTTKKMYWTLELAVESALNCGVNTTKKMYWTLELAVESALNCGVNTTFLWNGRSSQWVESALNCGVNTTDSIGLIRFDQVELVLNNNNQ